MITELHFWVIVEGVVLASIIIVAFVEMMREKRKSKGYVAALEQASDFTGNGLMFFDQNDRLISANSQAYDFLSGLRKPKDGEKKRFPILLSEVLDYFYDHAVDCDQSLLNTLGRSAEKLNQIGFREVIGASRDRLCLVEAQKIQNVGTNIILIDVGDVKSQEERMLRLNQYSYELHQAIQVATSGIIITKLENQGTEHVVVFANAAFCEIFERMPDEIVGQKISQVLGRIKDKALLRKILKIVGAEKTGNVELSLTHSENGESWYDLKLTPLKNDFDYLELFVGVMNDTTEMKIREAEFSKAQKLEALGQLAAGVAHDFNNVLSIIDGYARITEKNINDAAQVRENLERVRSAAQRGTGLIKQMLTFSRHEIVDNSVVELGEMVREQEVLLRPLLGASIRCRILQDHEAMHIECCPDNITQILMNLAVNARDAMPHGGSLLIESRLCLREGLPDALRDESADDSNASLIVSDTGTGMSKEILDRAFDPFFTTKEQGKGTGLGLSMVYGLVKQIGGHVDVDSVFGQGTKITVYFPLTTKRPKDIVGSVEDPVSIRFEGYTALVAEDEADLLDLVSAMLEELGMVVLRARDGHEALALQDEHEGSIDLLLTDVVMPELNGVNLAELMVELHPEISVIFMSGYPDKGQMARIDIPCEAVFIAKPLQHDDLIKVIYGKLANRKGATAGELDAPYWASKQEIEHDGELKK